MHKKAFTLAEVLITLSIIGVIGALTIPALTKSYEKAVFIASYKKVYSELSQATQLIMAENGGTMNGVVPFDHDAWKTIYATKLKAAIVCPESDMSKCSYGNIWKTLDGLTPEYAASPAGIVMKDGMYMGFFSGHPSTCIPIKDRAPEDASAASVCVFITVDTNGPKQPNRLGKDIHKFIGLANGVLPYDGCPGSAPTADCCDLRKSPDTPYRGITCGVEIMQGNLDWDH